VTNSLSDIQMGANDEELTEGLTRLYIRLQELMEMFGKNI